LFNKILRQKYRSIEEYPLLRELIQFSNLSPEKRKTGSECWSRDYFRLEDKDRKEMLVDEIFALYLFTSSMTVVESDYRDILAHAMLFRECLNDIGWAKRIEHEAMEKCNNSELQKIIKEYPYCLVNTAEHVPAISNDFVTMYATQIKVLKIEQSKIIECTFKLCDWLYDNNFTASKLST
jgi:hypothetical protein